MGGPGGDGNYSAGKEGDSGFFLMVVFISFTLFGFIVGLLAHEGIHQCPAKRASLQQVEKTRSDSLVKNVVEVCNRTMKSKFHIIKSKSEDSVLVYEILSCCVDETKSGCFQASAPTIIFHHRATAVELEKYPKDFRKETK